MKKSLMHGKNPKKKKLLMDLQKSQERVLPMDGKKDTQNKNS
jgi:hypothetical protein